jgi:hypothetical protein
LFSTSSSGPNSTLAAKSKSTADRVDCEFGKPRKMANVRKSKPAAQPSRFVSMATRNSAPQREPFTAGVHWAAESSLRFPNRVRTLAHQRIEQIRLTRRSRAAATMAATLADAITSVFIGRFAKRCRTRRQDSGTPGGRDLLRFPWAAKCQAGQTHVYCEVWANFAEHDVRTPGKLIDRLSFAKTSVILDARRVARADRIERSKDRAPSTF